MQKTLLIGYLGKDPEMKCTPGGTAITTFTIASTERWKNGAGEPQSEGRKNHTYAVWYGGWLGAHTGGGRSSVLRHPRTHSPDRSQGAAQAAPSLALPKAQVILRYLTRMSEMNWSTSRKSICKSASAIST